ncbi:RES domain-containing protein [Marinicauda salina]|uniref:RES domain-containing protein n=1 Tax=Marinicauda salina TaxID=2135793 RepID=A0A2U2BRX5_9PROT|nr:RES family NAD+ phosphorylase [Marinicauda salina]PWE16746.1 RES domain-containing protein [Marinicauda salina]
MVSTVPESERLAFPRTIRLISTGRLRESVLKPLVDTEDELAALAEIEGATSARLIAQDRGGADIHPNEFVYGVPHASFINASFAYAKPRELCRFNGPDRGAWYAALQVETCIREVAFHMTEFLVRSGEFETEVHYHELVASLAGEYVDLRKADPDLAALNPDPAIGYPAGNELAADLRRANVTGVVYPSARHEGGTCIAVFTPSGVQSVAQGAIYRFVWSGSPTPVVEKQDE